MEIKTFFLFTTLVETRRIADGSVVSIGTGQVLFYSEDAFLYEDMLMAVIRRLEKDDAEASAGCQAVRRTTTVASAFAFSARHFDELSFVVQKNKGTIIKGAM